MASIRDVAKSAGVSPATVSRTFATPNLISVSTQQRVLEVARQLNYHPRRHRNGNTPLNGAPDEPRAGYSGAKRTIGFQFFAETSRPLDTIATNMLYAPVFAGVQAEAASFGLHLLVDIATQNELDRFPQGPRMLQDDTISGVLIVGAYQAGILDRVASRVSHLVLIDTRGETGTHECVVSNSFEGGLLATRYLLNLGHRRIAFCLSRRGVPIFEDRLRGYLCALFEADVIPETRWIVAPAAGSSDLRGPLQEILIAPHHPTALVACSDEAALFALQVCREMRRGVPQDVSLVGFDDVPLGRHANPQLTTVHVDKEFMGRLAVRCLLARLHQETSPGTIPAVQHQVPVNLLIRESCRPA